MKKIVALTLALGLSSTAFASNFDGDGTSHVQLEIKNSNLTRSAVVAKTDSSDLSNSQDGFVAQKITPSDASRTEVVRKMEGYKFSDFGDGTSKQSWVKKESSNRNVAQTSK